VWAERNRFDFLAAYKSEKKVGKLKGGEKKKKKKKKGGGPPPQSRES
jgi:hypothetical protein